MKAKELKIECPLCHAAPGEACGNESHPERVEAAEEHKPKKIKHTKIHAVPKKKRRAA